MGDNTGIEWTDATWTPIRARNLVTGKIGWHCEHASEGCRNCYAEGINRRLGTGLDFKPGHRKDIEIFFDREMLLAPLRWKKPRMIFVCSMTDLFADFVSDEWIDRMFDTMEDAHWHTHQVLTKRAKRMREWVSRRFGLHRKPKNIWLGVSCEDQANADVRIPDLLATPAAVRFVSLEPLLGPIDLRKYLHGINQVIVGGESGPHARPMHPDWARSIRDQCILGGAKFFMKQMAKKAPIPGDLLLRQFP